MKGQYLQNTFLKSVLIEKQFRKVAIFGSIFCLLSPPKRELIEKFINENLPFIDDGDDVGDAFEAFLVIEKQKALLQLCSEEGLLQEKVTSVIGDYLFTERKPLPDDIVQMLEVKPKILERKTAVERVSAKIMGFIETFINGMGSA